MALPIPALLNPDPLPRLRLQITHALARLRGARTICEHDPWVSTCVRCDTQEAVLNVALEHYGYLVSRRRP